MHRLQYDGSSGLLFAANTEGLLRVWDVRSGWAVVADWADWYSKQGYGGYLSGGGYGVTDVVAAGAHVYVSGSDGSVRYLRKKREAMMLRLQQHHDDAQHSDKKTDARKQRSRR